MNDQPTLLQRVVEFLFSIGLPPIRIAQGAVFLLLAGGLFAWALLPSSDKPRKSRATDTEPVAIIEDTTDPELPAAELTVEQQIKELSYFNGNSSGYVLLASEIDQRDNKIETLRQRTDLTQEQKFQLDRIELSNHEMLLEKMIEDGVKHDVEQAAFLQFATAALSSEDEELRNRAAFAVTLFDAKHFASSATDDNFQKAIESLKKNELIYRDKKDFCERLLVEYLLAKKRNVSNANVDTCIGTLGEIFLKSENPEVETRGMDLVEFALFGKYDLQTLENRIRYQDRNALNDLDGALRVLESNPNVQLQKWQLLIRSYEALLSTGRFKDTETARKIMGELVSKLPDSDERKSELIQILERQKTRISAVGSTFDLTGTSILGDQILPSKNGFSLLVLANRNGLSRNLLGEIQMLDADTGKRYRQIIAFADAFTESDRASFDAVIRPIGIASEETAKKYLADFPMDFYPCLLLIDEKQTIICANLSLDQVANRIAAIESKRRKEKNRLLEAKLLESQ